MTISLSSLLVPNKTVSLDFPGLEGFNVQLCHHSRTELQGLRKKCVVTKWDRSVNAPVETLDEEKFVRNYSKAVVKGWTGLKLEYLKELLLVDLGDNDPEILLEFTEDNLILLMKDSPTFESWVQEEVTNLENFTKNK